MSTQKTGKWWERLTDLQAFVIQHGKLPSKTSADKAEKTLGVWLDTQRKAAKGQGASRPLTPEQVAVLDAVHPGWRNPLLFTWHLRLTDLQAFVIQHGKLPSKTSADKAEKTLGVWLDTQRQAEKGQSGRRPLTPEQAAALDAVSPHWRDPFLFTWYLRLADLQSFVTRHGKLPCQTSLDAAERRIGKWLSKQRHAAKGKGDRRPLTPEQITALDAVHPGWRRQNYLPDLSHLSQWELADIILGRTS